MKSYVRIPMIAAIVFEALALITAFAMYLNQDQIISSMVGTQLNVGKIYPSAITMYIIVFAAYIVFYIVMAAYDGALCRWVGDAMMAACILISIVTPYIISIQNITASSMGSDHLAALSLLSSQISMIVSPFSVIATALALVAIGRYSVEKECREAVPMEVNTAVFGDGYMPMQSYTSAQGSEPGSRSGQ